MFLCIRFILVVLTIAAAVHIGLAVGRKAAGPVYDVHPMYIQPKPKPKPKPKPNSATGPRKKYPSERVYALEQLVADQQDTIDLLYTEMILSRPIPPIPRGDYNTGTGIVLPPK